MNDVILDGKIMQDESCFHQAISELLGFGCYYGRNLDALWDRLSTDIERPIRIIWLNSDFAKECLGEYFNKIIGVFERVKLQDVEFNWGERFDYILK